MTALLKALPVSQEETIRSGAEQAVLALILRDSGLLPKISTFVSPHDFSDAKDRALFEAALALQSAGKPIDTVTLFDEFQKANPGATLSDRMYIIDIAQICVIPHNLEYYAQIVRRESKRRTIERGGYRMIEAAKSELDPDALQTKVASFLAELNSSWEPASIPSFSNRLDEAWNQIKQYNANLKADPYWMPGVKSGFPHLDNQLYGFQKGDFILVGARPSMGKTAFSLCLAENMALEGKHVAYFSLEMSAAALTRRMWARHTQYSSNKVPLNTLRLGNCQPSDWDSLEVSKERLAGCRISILNSYQQQIRTIDDIERWCRILANGEDPVELIIIDHIHLIGHPNEKLPHIEQLTNISRRLKVLADELQIPIIALAQLSRAVEEQKGMRFRPNLTHLRECGALEQDADVVLFLYRADYYVDKGMLDAREDEKHRLEVIVAKQREGKCDTVFLGFDDLYGHVYNLTWQGPALIRDFQSEQQEKERTMQLRPAFRDEHENGKRFIRSYDGTFDKEVFTEQVARQRVKAAIDAGKLAEFESTCEAWAAPEGLLAIEYEWRKVCFDVLKGAIRDLTDYKDGKPSLFGRLNKNA